MSRPHVEQWRLLLDGGASCAWNMAVDEAVFAHAGRAAGSAAGSLHAHSPYWTHTLRVYWFDPPALSIGALQRFAEVDSPACVCAGVDVVRRPSGGRAVLHDGCITYSLAGPADGPVFRDGIRPSYRRIATALVSAIRLLGLHDVAPAEPGSPAATSPACFDHAAPFEPLGGGHKLMGSAQARRGAAALQHGSLRLAPVRARTASLLVARGGARESQPGADPPSLGELLGRSVDRAEAAEALVQGFRTAFAVELCRDDMNPEERALAERLEAEKYRAPSWTERM